MTLVVRNGFPKNVFALIGRDENSATFALGWALERSPTFANAFVASLAGRPVATGELHIHLQTRADDRGFTDIELRCGTEFEAIIEAKAGWQVPSDEQFLRYCPRLATGGARQQLLVSVSAANARLARSTNLKLPERVDGLKVEHRSWGAIRALAKRSSAAAASFEEKLWLREFVQHMEGFAAMNRIRDNLVYVAALGSDTMVAGGSHTWIDVVEKDGFYFHPVGDRFPRKPVNYIGFRYRGRLQSVHRVASFEIMPDVRTVNPLWYPSVGDHFVYKLGPAMRPPVTMKAGSGIRMSARAWCAIDTLLSGEFETLTEARDETKRRLAEAEQSED